LDGLSGGRFRVGLGVSGPQVVEGWHGQPFGKPLGRTREYIEILRRIFRREKPLEFRGEYYQIPYAGPDATGLGKPLKSILHGRGDIPIYLAAVGPRNTALAAEIADGWIPTFFSPRYMKSFREWLDEGFRARGGAPARFDIMPMVSVVVGDDVAACRQPVRARLALYVGGMGARGRNFYNDIARRYGYEAGAKGVVEQVEKGGGQALAVRADVSTAADNQAIVEKALARWGRLDIFFANAGVPQLPTHIEEQDEAVFDRIFAVNVKGVWLGAKYALAVMKKQKRGVFLITASTAAIRPRPGGQTYAASKGAVVTLAKSLALEAAPHGVRVVAIAPVATE